MSPAELAEVFPYLFHMAHRDSWDSIQKHGLLSTAWLTELFELDSLQRAVLTEGRRPESVPISHPTHGTAVIRDNKPLSDNALEKCLDGMTLPEWYALLNSRVYFWPTQTHLDKFLCARAYRLAEHLVIRVPTLAIADACRDRLWVSRINSGSTMPHWAPKRRGRDTFVRLADYQADQASKVYELAVDGAVPDIRALSPKAYIAQCPD
ncbi:MAG: hypothetical protein OXG38_07565 [Chloroflexi bacterium]|nr:hypothetical protein [Chloroflexota bacterium]